MGSITSEVRGFINATVETLGREHFARKFGSAPLVDGVEDRTAAAALGILNSVDYTNVTETMDQACRDVEKVCRYFRFEGIKAMHGIQLLGDLTDKQLATVRLVRAEHQDDAGNRIDFVSGDIPPYEVNHGHVIVGPHEGQQIVWTWHPGDVVPMTDCRTSVCKLIHPQNLEWLVRS